MADISKFNVEEGVAIIEIDSPPVNALRIGGFRAQPILESLNIDRNLLSDVNETVALQKYISFFEAAAEVTKNPYFGVDAGKSINSDSLGALGFLFASAPTLRNTVEGLASYLGALQEGTKMNILEIAQKVGYLETASFTRAFQKESGKTPTQYRKSAYGKGLSD